MPKEPAAGAFDGTPFWVGCLTAGLRTKAWRQAGPKFVTAFNFSSEPLALSPFQRKLIYKGKSGGRVLKASSQKVWILCSLACLVLSGCKGWNTLDANDGNGGRPISQAVPTPVPIVNPTPNPVVDPASGGNSDPKPRPNPEPQPPKPNPQPQPAPRPNPEPKPPEPPTPKPQPPAPKPQPPAQPPDSPLNAGDIPIPKHLNHLQFEDAVPVEQKNAFNETIAALYVDSIQDAKITKAILGLLKIADVKATTLQNWLEDRVQYLVSEDYAESNVFIAKTSFVYPNPGLMPIDDIGFISPLLAQNGNARILMSNIGGGVYIAGKEQKQLLGLHIQGIGDVNVTSPRVGVLKIGQGLIYDANTQNIAADTFRLGVLFHEARHSDGNGKSLAFTHALCPKGSDYEGLAACDRASNGPYTVGALMMLAMLESCQSCNTQMQEWLKVEILDQATRIIQADGSAGTASQSKAPQIWDDTPEGKR